MNLAVMPPLEPMEARIAETVPVGPDWQYEPKWDGFRCLAFRDGETIELQSKASKSLTRYFPELAAALGALGARRFVLDGEIVIPVNGQLSFDDLLQRIHPARSRVARLARERPAILIAFDLLVDERNRALSERPLAERRERLERFAERYFTANGPVRISPASTDVGHAQGWLAESGADLDGVIAKRCSLHYESGNRDGMVKIKRRRTADCVVGGFRYGQASAHVASLLLGLYDAAGLLQHVGFTSGLRAADKPRITRQLEPLIEPPGFTGAAPGGPSRWATARSTEWQPLRPELVVEVSFDHFSGGRFRHGTKLLRWRPDKSPHQCTFEQVRPRGRLPISL